jgi:CheY-like chemotaxis protein
VKEEIAGGVERKRAVVVEDDQDTRDMLVELIGLLGHDVVGVASGRAAITACIERRPDVMFIDLGLPDMSGHDVAVELREDLTTRSTFLVALTGRSQPRDIDRSFQAGIDLHLAKPVGMYVLRKVFASLNDDAPSRWAEGSGRWSPSDLGIVPKK